MALTELGLIDEYQIVVHPRIVGRGPTLFAGLTKMVDLKLVGHEEFGSGAVAMRYAVTRQGQLRTEPFLLPGLASSTVGLMAARVIDQVRQTGACRHSRP